MKKYFSLIVFILAFTVNGIAQLGPSDKTVVSIPADSVLQKQAEQLKVKLNLTDAQALLLKKLHIDFLKGLQQLHERKLSKEDFSAGFKVLIDGQNTELKKILTADQYTKLKQDQAARGQQNQQSREALKVKQNH